MEKNLSDVSNYIEINNKFSQNSRSKQIKFVQINGEIIVIKSTYQDHFFREKNIYNILNDEDFLPKLRYFDSENYILGFTYVGDSLQIYKKKHPSSYRKLIPNLNNQIKIIIDKLEKKYNLYHNDLREKNICIDDNNVIRFIDFELTNKILMKKEKKYLNNWGGKKNNYKYFICK